MADPHTLGAMLAVECMSSLMCQGGCEDRGAAITTFPRLAGKGLQLL